MYAELMRKTCSKCRAEQSISEFYKSSRYADGHESWCKACKKSHAKANIHINRNWVIKNQSRVKKMKQRYVEANIEKVRASKRKWAKANPKKELAKTTRYQLAKLHRTPKWLTREDIKSIEVFYVNCPKGYHVDHIVPLQGKNVSGLHVLSNLQYLPALINLQKSNKY